MSKTAAGNIQGTNSSTISGKFVEDDGTEHFCTGTIDPATVFVVSEAVLTYNGSLLGKHTYQGTVGKTAIALTQDNGYTITGNLDDPVASRTTVTGSLSWSTRQA